MADKVKDKGMGSVATLGRGGVKRRGRVGTSGEGREKVNIKYWKRR